MNAPTRLLTGAFDLALLFVVLFPVVIGLSYELLSEKEHEAHSPCYVTAHIAAAARAG